MCADRSAIGILNLSAVHFNRSGDMRPIERYPSVRGEVWRQDHIAMYGRAQQVQRIFDRRLLWRRQVRSRAPQPRQMRIFELHPAEPLAALIGGCLDRLGAPHMIQVDGGLDLGAVRAKIGYSGAFEAETIDMRIAQGNRLGDMTIHQTQCGCRTTAGPTQAVQQERAVYPGAMDRQPTAWNDVGAQIGVLGFLDRQSKEQSPN